MIDLNYLGHNLEEGWHIKDSINGAYFTCPKCQSAIYYSTKNKTYSYYKTGILEKLNLTCEEMIIKRLLE